MKKILEDIGFYVGTIVGAGMFAMPYAVSRAGIWWSLFFFIFTLILLTFFHLLYGNIIYHINSKHRLPGYVRQKIGARSALLAGISTIISLYGALLVYGILGGSFLAHLTGLLTPFWWSLIFFAALAPFLFFSFDRIGFLNFLLSLPLVAFILFLFFKALPMIDTRALIAAPPRDIFLPYGIFLFAFMGLSAIPEMVEVMRKRNKSTLTYVVMGGSVGIALLYLLFVIAVVGVAGEATAPDALTSLGQFFGRGVVMAGEIVALLAVITSFLAIGIDLRAMFHYDYGYPHAASWLLVVSIPFILFMLGFAHFIGTVEFLGAVTVALNGVFVLWLGRHEALITRSVAWLVGAALIGGIGIYLISVL